MFEYKKIVALSILSVSLVGIVVTAVAINPLIGAILGPALLGVAAIINAVNGKEGDDGAPRSPSSKTPKSLDRGCADGVLDLGDDSEPANTR